MTSSARVALCMLLGLASACALTSRSRPLALRYFTPSDEGPPAGSTTTVSGQTDLPPLRVRRVSAAAHLGLRLVHRESPHEIGYYEGWRWSERPETYLLRALSRVLYEDRGIVRAVSGAAPNLDVVLTAFEEIEGVPHRARLELVLVLSNGRVSRLDETVRVEEPILEAKDAGTALVDALSRALERAVALTADRVVAELRVIAREEAEKAAAEKAAAEKAEAAP